MPFITSGSQLAGRQKSDDEKHRKIIQPYKVLFEGCKIIMMAEVKNLEASWLASRRLIKKHTVDGNNPASL